MYLYAYVCIRAVVVHAASASKAVPRLQQNIIYVLNRFSLARLRYEARTLECVHVYPATNFSLNGIAWLVLDWTIRPSLTTPNTRRGTIHSIPNVAAAMKIYFIHNLLQAKILLLLSLFSIFIRMGFKIKDQQWLVSEI